MHFTDRKPFGSPFLSLLSLSLVYPENCEQCQEHNLDCNGLAFFRRKKQATKAYAYALEGGGDGEGGLQPAQLRKFCDFSGKMLMIWLATLESKHYKIILLAWFPKLSNRFSS